MTEEGTTAGQGFAGEFVTCSPEETFDLARRIGEQLNQRTVFLLTGDLGAGKTVFAKGLAAGLGIEPSGVTSPSFTLINIHEGRLRLYHIDLYRLESGDRQDLGLDEIFAEPGSVAVVEWAERLRHSPPAYHVQIEHLSEFERRVRIDFG
jgi:tRNA threonylcarbamoyladenosine biosynthesis protein TsaE